MEDIFRSVALNTDIVNYTISRHSWLDNARPQDREKHSEISKIWETHIYEYCKTKLHVDLKTVISTVAFICWKTRLIKNADPVLIQVIWDLLDNLNDLNTNILIKPCADRRTQLASPSHLAWRAVWFSRKMSFYQYRKSQCGEKTIVRSSHLDNRNPYTSNMASWYCWTNIEHPALDNTGNCHFHISWNLKYIFNCITMCQLNAVQFVV